MPLEAIAPNISNVRQLWDRTEKDSHCSSVPEVSLIVVHYRQRLLLERMLQSVGEQSLDVEILIADASGDIARSALSPNVRVCPVENNGYAAAVNSVALLARGDILAVCNADVILHEDCLYELVDYLRRNNDAAVVAPQLVNADGSPQNNARRFYTWRSALWARCPLRGVMSHPGFFRRYLMADEPCGAARSVDWVMGAFFVIRREALLTPGEVFDTRYRFYMEDVDLCLDMWRRGWKVVQLPQAVATHMHGRASRKVISRAGFHHFASFAKFLLKHHGLPQRA